MINSCPMCFHIDGTLTSLVLWKGCGRCRFGVKEYQECQLPYGEFDHKKYSNLMRRRIQDIQTEELIKGVLDEE